MSVSLDDVRNDITYLLGNETQISPWPTSYDNFIQKALQRITRYTDFDFGQTTATISLTSGVGSLPTNARQSPELDVREVVDGFDNDNVFTPVPYQDKDQYGTGDYRYWLTTDSTGVQTINTTEPTVAAVTARYSLAAPTLNASIGTNFPSSMVIAKGALVYIREAEDKDADTAPEDAKFRIELEEVISAMQRNQPIEHARYVGGYTGDPGERDYKFSTLRTP